MPPLPRSFLDLAQPASLLTLKTKIEVWISYRGQNGTFKKVASPSRNASANADYDTLLNLFSNHSLQGTAGWYMPKYGLFHLRPYASSSTLLGLLNFSLKGLY